MVNEPIYGSEALRRFREQQAAQPTNAQAPESMVPPSGRAPRLQRQTQIRVTTNTDEQSVLEERARRAGLTLSNYFRALAGMPPISAGRPSPVQELKREEWVRGNRAELDAQEINP
jgi:hypothetical protein